MKLSDWISIVSVTITALMALRTIVSERRARASAATAREQATRSIDAAARAADAQQRLAELAEAQAAKYPVPWRLEHVSGLTFALINRGDDREYAVQVRGVPIIDRWELPPQDVDGRSRFQFRANVSTGSENMVVVTWHHRGDRSDERLSWTHPLPAERN